jgi:diphosphomevalonate decarboxylase
MANSTDELAIPIRERVHPIFASYHDAILVIDSSPKPLSSTSGHKLMNHHVYKETRYKQANDNLQRLLKVLSSGDEMKFEQIIENEALSLHGLLMSSMPGHILMHPNTLVVLRRIKEFRAQTNLPLSFTLDAGPNVHLLYPENIRTQVVSFIESDLKQFCENGFWIDDQVSSIR